MMLFTQSRAAPVAAHLFSAHLLPAAVLLLSGALVWKWRQERRATALHAQQMQDLQQQMAELKAQQVASTAPPASHKAAVNVAATSHNALFEQLIKENIALRTAN